LTPGARIQAAIELLDRIETPRKGEEALPADAVLNSYFRSRRYVGAKDRRAIGDAVFQTLRQRGYIDWVLKGEAGLPASNRFRALWAFAVHRGVDGMDLAQACDGSRYHPAPLTEDEAWRVKLLGNLQMDVPLRLADQASFPDWLAPEIERQFGDPRSGGDAWAEMLAFTQAAPTDLRVNTLKATREEAAAALAKSGIDAAPARYSPVGLRLEARANVAAHGAFRDGWIEVQDEASQLAALLTGAKPGMRILDLCAGAGGKALALAAAMGNRGGILACDSDAKRLARLGPRRARSGAGIVESRALGKGKAKAALGKFDRVLVDAPCSGSGTWRRHPEAKWRLTPAMLETYRKTQAALLRRAAQHVGPNGRLVYAVCSVLPSEGAEQIEAFRNENRGWRVIPADKAWREALGSKAPFDGPYMLLTPHRHRTDGFFATILAPP
jgi:16S rRNA (cytosine967-C5)-methyltransferase